jgi:hypothetical protein
VDRPPVLADHSRPMGAVVVRRLIAHENVQQPGSPPYRQSLSWLSIREISVAAPKLQRAAALPVWGRSQGRSSRLWRGWA